MKERNNTFFQRQEINPRDNDGASTSIVLDSLYRQHYLSHCPYNTGDIYDGKCKIIIISFNDPSVLETAVKNLQTSGVARIYDRGRVKTSEQTWSNDDPTSNYQDEEEGIISCDLRLKDGFLEPLSYQVKKTDETSKLNQVIPDKVVTRKQATEPKTSLEESKKDIQYTNTELSKISAILDKLKESHRLYLDKKTESAIFVLRDVTDNSDGAYRDLNEYIFSASHLKTLIFSSLCLVGDGKFELITESSHHQEFEDDPPHSQYEVKVTNKTVPIKLELTKKDGTYSFSVNEIVAQPQDTAVRISPEEKKREENKVIVINEIIKKINESLPVGHHNNLTRTLDGLVLKRENKPTDLSGDNCNFNIDSYCFSNESFLQLILLMRGSSKQQAEVIVPGTHKVDIEDWNSAGGNSQHTIENIPLKLNLTIKNGKYIFTADRYDDKREVMAIDETISENGRKVLKMVTDHNSNTKYKYQGQVYEWLGDPALLDFGNLNDLETPCKLVINEYQTPETSTDGDYGEDCREILYFDKKLAIEALSKVKEGITVVTGTGRAVDYKYRYGWSYNENVDENKRDTDKKVEVAIQIDFQPKKSLVNFEFKTRIDPKQDSVVYKRVSFWDSKNIS